MKKKKITPKIEKKVSVNKNYKKLVKTGKVTLAKGFRAPKKKKAVKAADENKLNERGLNMRQELFCVYYASDREFFGNGVQSYIEVYEPNQSRPNWYKSACAAASQLLSNIKVCKRISELLSVEGFNDEFVDKQLLFVIAQHDDKSAKVAAIREFNKLRGRITEKIDHTTKGKELPVPILGGASNVSTNNSD